MEELKQVIIVRADIEMGRGKAGAQCGHAAVSSYLECLKAHKDVAEAWSIPARGRYVLKVDTEEALNKFYEAFKFKNILRTGERRGLDTTASRDEDCAWGWTVEERGD